MLLLVIIESSEDPPSSILANTVGERFLEHSYSLNDVLEEPILLPPAVRQKFVDYFSEEDLKVKKKLVLDSRRLEYNAESTVYRAIEKLNEKMIVLHGLKYKSDQWSGFSKEQKSPEAGEHDFAVLLPNKTVIVIEVKRPSRLANIQPNLKDAVKQLDRFERFFRDLVSFADTKIQYTIFKFCAFPEIEKNEIPVTDLEKIEASPIIWRDDLKDFRETLLRFGVSFETDVDVVQYVSKVNALMIGLWLKNSSGFEEEIDHPYKLAGLIMRNHV